MSTAVRSTIVDIYFSELSSIQTNHATSIRSVMWGYPVERFRISVWSHFSTPHPCRSALPFVSFSRSWRMLCYAGDVAPLQSRKFLSAEVLFIKLEFRCCKKLMVFRLGAVLFI